MGKCVSQHALLGQLGADGDHLEQGHEEGRGDTALDCKDSYLSDRVSNSMLRIHHLGRVRRPGADPGADYLPMPGVEQLAELSLDPSTLHTILVLATNRVIREKVLIWALTP